MAGVLVVCGMSLWKMELLFSGGSVFLRDG